VRSASFDYDYDMGLVGRALGIKKGIAAGWVAPLSLIVLVALGLGVLSQTPTGNPIWRLAHSTTAAPVPLTAAQILDPALHTNLHNAWGSIDPKSTHFTKGGGTLTGATVGLSVNPNRLYIQLSGSGPVFSGSQTGDLEELYAFDKGVLYSRNGSDPTLWTSRASTGGIVTSPLD
jgi:hypothetical protein